MFFNKEKRILKKYQKEVKKINQAYEKVKNLSNEELKEKISENRIEKLAIIKEACKRSLNMELYDVQLIGALALIDKNIAEMKTGEGKSLTAAVAATYIALEEKQVYIVTVNEYLVKRDEKEHRPLFLFFNLSSGIVIPDRQENKKLEYLSKIIYSTATELGFDYLRDNLVYTKKEQKQKDLDFVIIDEIDSILIDEATTPMIISETSKEENGELFKINQIAKKLKKGKETKKRIGLEIEIETSEDFFLNQKEYHVYLTEKGIKKVEKELKIENLYTYENSKYVKYIENALMANHFYKEGIHYIKKEGEIILIDQSTGRLTPGRQLSNGLHQAIEAKEGIMISPFTEVKGEISYQKFFLSFKELSGMTGTAATESQEFYEIYKLQVITIPTNKPIKRIDKNDAIFVKEKDKEDFFIKEVKRIHKSGQPILIGTTSIETNEKLEKLLKKENLKINILNAKNTEKESEIISKAGIENSITLATNMAGRGVDIKLTKKAKELGGLYVLGYERYKNRRIDNQLRGRAGRQGDPGSSQFFVSFEDELIKIFGSVKTDKLPKEKLEGKFFNKIIEKAQRTIENQNFESRKHLVEYDSVIGKQRDKIFEIRNELLENFNTEEKINNLLDYIVGKIFENVEENLTKYLKIEVKGLPKEEKELKRYLSNIIGSKFQIFKGNQEEIRATVRYIYLKNLDQEWINHLTMLESLRTGIHLRGYNQKDPLVEFQKESFLLFQEMIEHTKINIINDFLYINIKFKESLKKS